MRAKNFLDIATKIATKKDDKRAFIVGAVGVRSDGVIVMASNGPTPNPSRLVHAEYRISRKLDYGSIVYVVRLRRDGSLAMAKPCADCEKALRSKHVKEVWYSTADGAVDKLEL